MQERYDLSDKQINSELLGSVLATPLRWWGLIALTGLLLAGGIAAAAWMVTHGLGVTGLGRPIFWGFMIVNFVFWVGISHAGVMISAILRLSSAEWRRPVTRAAEVLTVFALATAAIFPLIHMGRPWRFYWIFPVDFWRGIWPNVRSPLVWDPSAIFTYLTGSSLFVFVALIPDLAVIRDRSAGVRRAIYGFLAMGFRGTPRQWKLQTIAGILLSALILPVFVSVHSIVSWDFGMALGVPNWHTSVLAPYFVIGAVHSGVSAVVTLMAILRKVFKWENYITPDHFDALGRLLVVVATAWLYFFILEFLFGLYSREQVEVVVREYQLGLWPNNILFGIFILTAYIIPVPLWLFRRVRRSITLMFWTSILVNVGMWMERFIIIVPALEAKQGFSFMYQIFTPSLVEVLLVLGSFGLVGTGLLLFAKFFPLIPLFDIKEGQVLKAEIQVGKVKVPAVIHE